MKVTTRAFLCAVVIAISMGIWAVVAWQHEIGIEKFMAPGFAIIRGARVLGVEVIQRSNETNTAKAMSLDGVGSGLRAWWFSCVFWIAVLPSIVGLIYWLKLKKEQENE